MATVTIELKEDDTGSVKATVNFDPPLLPGMDLPATHKAALRIFKGTALEPVLDFVGVPDDAAIKPDKPARSRKA